MSYQLLEFSVDDGVATIAFNRPDRRNAMNDDMRSEFVTALETVSGDKAIRALVLTGRGSAFCAGGDIAGMKRRLEAPQGEVAFNGTGSRVSIACNPFCLVCPSRRSQQ